MQKGAVRVPRPFSFNGDTGRYSAEISSGGAWDSFCTGLLP